MNINETISSWVATRDRTYATSTIANAKLGIEDTVACMIGGTGTDVFRRASEALPLFGQGESTVILASDRAGISEAALLNAIAGHALDYDDTFSPAVSHPTSVTVAALLAVGESLGSSGLDIIDAYIVGLEVQNVLAKGVMRSHYTQGWHSTSTLGAIGAAGAVARLLELSEHEFQHALSLATSMAGGFKAQFGTDAKPLQAGLAAQHGVQAAVLAKCGVRGNPAALDGPLGFLELFGGANPPGWDPANLAIGIPLSIDKPGLMIKRFPCCAATHKVLDGLFEVMAEYSFTHHDVEALSVTIGYSNAQNLMYDNPASPHEAKFSMQFCCSAALVTKEVNLKTFSDSNVRSEDIRSMYKRISVSNYTKEQEDGPTKLPHIISLTLKDGTMLKKGVQATVGTIENPIDAVSRRKKFYDCADMSAINDAKKVYDVIQRLDSLPDVRELMALLSR